MIKSMILMLLNASMSNNYLQLINTHITHITHLIHSLENKLDI